MVARVAMAMDKLGSTGKYPAVSGVGASAQIGEPKVGVSPIVLMTAGAIIGSAATLLMKMVSK